jgi:DNA-binding transcriptional MerR regulator
MTLKIGLLAKRTGTNTPTIRYYEEIGLLPRPNRRDGGQRSYSEDDVRRLTFIRRCREFGFPIDQVKTLAGLVQDQDRSCVEIRDVANAHLASVRAKLVELNALESSLATFVEECDAACAGGPGSECVIIRDMSASNCCGSSRGPAGQRQ